MNICFLVTANYLYQTSREKPSRRHVPKTASARRQKTYIRDEPLKDIELDLESGCKDSTVPGAEKVTDNALEWVKTVSRKGLRPILKEFATVRKFIPPNMSTDVFNQNPSKNRYTDVMCLDKTRVILKDRTKSNDYIHASWVQLPSNRKYICTQGPLDETIEDFWWMIFKEEVQAIVMLCDFIEDGEQKCAEYYPLTTGEKVQYGEITVKKLKEEEAIQMITCQMMSVKYDYRKIKIYKFKIGRGETHHVNHYRWSSWPDRSAPSSSAPLISLILKIKALHDRGPVVIHCSAGIGRTGTLCAVDYAMDKFSEEATLSPADVVKAIRHQRLHSVQSVLQYLYMHICLVDYVIFSKSLPKDMPSRKFRRDYEKYLKKFTERLAKEKQTVGNT
ncbi:unnamed protein product [Thelazia callipaeda]|uniref:Protein-tyrosine phosphatase n=1 Tax=Thelazia callipaeda TaxID=103827 RepID=A0A0N5D971_THECL|nr:unnamed protein product [Thelazia callipaeda]